MEYTYTEEKGGVKPDGSRYIIKYKVTPSGTAYHRDTPDSLVQILENLRNSRARVRIYLGDRNTGRDWEESSDVFGAVGRSTGRIKIPILVNNARSFGGGALLDNCIVKLEYANKKDGGVIWQHPKYHRGSYPVTRVGAPMKTKKGKIAKRVRRGQSAGAEVTVRGVR